MINQDGFNRKIQLLQNLESEVMKETYKFFKSITPKDTGNAKNKTVLIKHRITGNYPYAKRLDEGWSKQAPTGIIKPSIRNMLDNIKTYLRKIK